MSEKDNALVKIWTAICILFLHLGHVSVTSVPEPQCEFRFVICSELTWNSLQLFTISNWLCTLRQVNKFLCASSTLWNGDYVAFLK